MRHHDHTRDEHGNKRAEHLAEWQGCTVLQLHPRRGEFPALAPTHQASGWLRTWMPLVIVVAVIVAVQVLIVRVAE